MGETQGAGQSLKHVQENFTATELTILKRRSVRWYKQEQVPEQLVKRILEAGRFAPSAGNCQPWKFVVIREPRIISELTASVVKICRFFKAFLEYRTPGNSWKLPLAKLFTLLMPAKLHPVPFGAIPLIADGRLSLYHGAPTVIMIFKDRRGVSNPDLDCGIAGQNMALAAHSMGLGTCWVSFSRVAFDYPGFKWNKRFGIKYPYKFISSLAIGWPAGNPDGFVERSTHRVDWYENGEKTVTDCSGTAAEISLAERFTIPDYTDPAQTSWGELRFDYGNCNGCGTCERICPACSIVMKENKPAMKAGSDCMACGDCVAICPSKAIRLESGYGFSKFFKTIDHGGLSLPKLK